MSSHDDRGRFGPKETRGALREARPMRRGTLALAVATALVLGAVGGAALGVLFRAPVTLPAPNGTEYLFLTIGFDFANGLDKYMPANVTVPTHTPVLVTITNYDNASNPVDNATAIVRGTVGNVETIQSASDATAMTMAAVPANQVSHTFTMDGGLYSINAPIPAAAGRGNPMIVTFTAYFNVTGSFEWHCMAPCDALSMTTPGFMRGTVTVVET